MRSISKQTSCSCCSCCSWAYCRGHLCTGLRSRGTEYMLIFPSDQRQQAETQCQHNRLVSPFNELWRQAIETMLVCRPHFPRIRIAGRRPITPRCGFASASPGPCAHPGRWFLPPRESKAVSFLLLRGPAARCPMLLLFPLSLTASVCSSLTQSLITVHLRRPEGHQSRLSLRVQAPPPSVPPPAVHNTGSPPHPCTP